VYRRYIAIYGVPVFSFRKEGEHLQCTSCGEAFSMDVLTAAPGLLQREPCDPGDLRRAMLLVFAEAKRVNADSLMRIWEWCKSSGFPSISVEDLEQESTAMLASSLTFAQFAPIQLRALSPAERSSFVLNARQLLAAGNPMSAEEQQVLKHVAFKLGVPSRVLQSN
jgi:hypothetical protein